MPAGINPATERRSARVKERVSVPRTKTRPDREPSRTSNTAKPTKKNNPPLYTRNQILQNAVQPTDVHVNLEEIRTNTTSNDSNDDIRTSLNTLTKAVSDLKDHLTSVSDTVKSLKEQSDSSMEDQVLQQNTVQGDMMDEPCASSHQPGTITEQRPNNSQNGTITHIDFQVPETNARCRPRAYTCTSSTNLTSLDNTVDDLLKSSLANSTRKQYNKIWIDFRQFCISHLSITDSVIPISIHTLSLYLASLYERGYAPSTMSTYNSAISYWHKINNVSDPTASFLIYKLIHGAKKKRCTFDGRLPITITILERLVTGLNIICKNPFYQMLFKAMYTVAFFAFLRVGEMTERSVNTCTNNHCLKMDNIEIQSEQFIISFSSFKHSVPGKVHKILINRQQKESICPVKYLLAYLKYRSSQPGIANLFCHLNGSPISRSQFIDTLNKSLNFIGLSSKYYKGHSFRIGAASWALQNGKSDSQIRSLGRWKSNAFLKYLRPDVSSN